jgi:hypothetical protein
MSPDALVAEMSRRYVPGKVPRDLVYYLSIGEHKFVMRLTATGCAITPGKVEKADCVIKSDPTVFANLVIHRKAPGPFDIARGKFKTSDVGLLTLLQDCFR